MCVGIPLRLVSVTGILGRAETGEAMDMSLCPDARPGDWVLTHLGTAREVISAHEALLIRAALDGLESVMAGGSAGAAFADLDARTPSLPPHLQAALDAGLAEG